MTAKKILLPKIPDYVVQEIYKSVNDEKDLVQKNQAYKWVSASDTVQKWCKENICPNIHWGIQIISGNLAIHKDTDTQVKFNYIIDRAGNCVVTKFYDNNMNVIDTVEFEEREWYILNVSTYHDVTGIANDAFRISVTGRIFPN